MTAEEEQRMGILDGRRGTTHSKQRWGNARMKIQKQTMNRWRGCWATPPRRNKPKPKKGFCREITDNTLSQNRFERRPEKPVEESALSRLFRDISLGCLALNFSTAPLLPPCFLTPGFLGSTPMPYPSLMCSKCKRGASPTAAIHCPSGLAVAQLQGALRWLPMTSVWAGVE